MSVRKVEVADGFDGAADSASEDANQKKAKCRIIEKQGSDVALAVVFYDEVTPRAAITKPQVHLLQYADLTLEFFVRTAEAGLNPDWRPS